ncbi:uncharacterized protein LOC120183203 isoform X2 [Hibiscus syriacus]|uniref:uncharacterized protein LOC120183203 isoform X2 n=1 Tax=Hibiscus syriacus TaxID=106335 RepID=UPI001922A2E6|nr:uncharacterized protein LOC120183203 isoform X2 [Hibiscus syriacus]
MGDGDDQDKEEFRENLTDVKLKEKIKRQERILEYLASKLPDKGKKIRDRLQQLEEGKKRRTFTRQKMYHLLDSLLMNVRNSRNLQAHIRLVRFQENWDCFLALCGNL